MKMKMPPELIYMVYELLPCNEAALLNIKYQLLIDQTIDRYMNSPDGAPSLAFLELKCKAVNRVCFVNVRCAKPVNEMAALGQFKSLQYLYKAGCHFGFTNDLVLFALAFGHLDIAKWLLSVGLDYSAFREGALLATKLDQLKSLQWIHKVEAELGVKVHHDMDEYSDSDMDDDESDYYSENESYGGTDMDDDESEESSEDNVHDCHDGCDCALHSNLGHMFLSMAHQLVMESAVDNESDWHSESSSVMNEEIESHSHRHYGESEYDSDSEYSYHPRRGLCHIYTSDFKLGYMTRLRPLHIRLFPMKGASTGLQRSAFTEELMNIAASSGNLNIVRWLHENHHDQVTKDAMDLAAQTGQLEVVKFLHEYRKEGCTLEAMDNAAYYGHLNVVKWLHENRQEGCSHFAMDGAAEREHLEVVKWLHENRSEGCTTDAMDKAAGNGHLAIVQFLHQHRKEGCTYKAMDLAAQNGHLSVFKWLHQNRKESCSILAAVFAGLRGQKEILAFMKPKKNEFPAFVYLKKFHSYKHMDLYKYFDGLGLEHESFSLTDGDLRDEFREFWHAKEEICTGLFNYACSVGQLDVVVYLRWYNPEFSESSILFAASHGQLNVIKWMHRISPEQMTTTVMDTAVCFGRLNIVKFLFDECQLVCSTDAYNLAKSREHNSVVQFWNDAYNSVKAARTATV